MFTIRILWLIYLLVYTEQMMAEYFQVEMQEASVNHAYRVLSSSTKISCVLACKQQAECTENGLDADGNCYLFKNPPTKNDISKQIATFRVVEKGLFACTEKALL